MSKMVELDVLAGPSSQEWMCSSYYSYLSQYSSCKGPWEILQYIKVEDWLTKNLPDAASMRIVSIMG